MKTRSELEALEQTDIVKFHKEVEKFAAGEYILTKDNYEDVVAAMLDAADEQKKKTPVETIQLSNCCGASPTELCNEDNGFCPECRDHTEFIDVCVECSEEDCVCVIQCNLDTGCGETPCICREEYFDRHLMFTDGNQMFMDADGILQGAK